jgi:D-alanine-D-alanine ligase
MNHTGFGKVAVLMGGDSAEREISLLSGGAVLAALLRQGVDAHAIDPKSDDIASLPNEGFLSVFNILHGRGGEDGVIQGELQRLALPYTGSGVLGSALAMDKYRSKLLWRGVGLPTPEFALLNGVEDLAAADGLGYPLMVKPVREGSSIGMAKVDNRVMLEAAWREAAGFDDQVLAERWITGSEYTAAVLQHQLLPLIRLETPREFYDYEAKYHADTTRYHCPCGLPQAEERKLQELAWQAFTALGADGWGRVDMMVDENGNPWLIEVNTVPGMTDHSLVPMAAKQAGISFDELVLRILETSGQGDGA